MLVSYLQESIHVLEQMAGDADLQKGMEKAVDVIVGALKYNKPLLIAGNGGSSADAQHITGELVGRFLKERQALKVICLADNPVVLTALGNDYGYDTVFSRQVEAYGEKGGIFLGISTSGNSPNILKAIEIAKAKGMITIGLTGAKGLLRDLVDIALCVPSTRTPLIQQGHMCLYHYLCDRVEQAFCVPSACHPRKA